MKQSAFSKAFRTPKGRAPVAMNCPTVGIATAHIKKAPLEAEQVSRPREIDWSQPLILEPLDGQDTATRFVKEILDSIQDARISRIGIHRMGGVGETSIVKHVHNKS
uniref:Uncharacterized protein n=2 Tax=Nymphaea colorata TaxID=210225 RepID=A0A5K0UW05_9MAGN